MQNRNMKKYLEYSAFTVMLGASLLLGFLGRSVEMGLSIVAGAMALTFLNLDKFTKIKGAGFEAELKEQVESIIEKETESVIQSGGATIKGYGLVGDSIKIVEALGNPKYTWRYPSGLAKEAGVNIKEVQKTLDWLKEHMLARVSSGKNGDIWALTSKGREALLGEKQN